LTKLLAYNKLVRILNIKRFIVTFKGLPSRVRLLALSGNIRLGWKVPSVMDSLSSKHLGINCKGKEFYNTQVWYFIIPRTKGRPPALSAYIKLEWNWLVLSNVLVYNKAVIIVDLKRFLVPFMSLHSRLRPLEI